MSKSPYSIRISEKDLSFIDLAIKRLKKDKNRDFNKPSYIIQAIREKYEKDLNLFDEVK